MTTIAYRDGILASDSRLTQGHHIAPGYYSKIYRLSDGSLFAGTGLWTMVMRFKEWMESDDETEEMPTWRKGADIVSISPDGAIMTYDGSGMWLEHKATYGAWGSGEAYAYGAMAAGASASEAVKIAKKFDVASGGPVRTLKLREGK